MAYSVEFNRAHGIQDDQLELRFKRLRFIEEHIGADVCRNDPVIANGLALLRHGDVDIDQGMALLCRELSNGMRRLLSMLVDSSLRNPAPIVINGVPFETRPYGTEPIRCVCSEDVEPRWFICDSGPQRMSSIHCDHCRVSAGGSTREQAVQAWNNMQRNMREENRS